MLQDEGLGVPAEHARLDLESVEQAKRFLELDHLRGDHREEAPLLQP
jgi:hypothetical protein